MEWLFIFTIVLLLWFWSDASATREIAVSRARSLCYQSGVMFLDDSVALNQLRLRRNRSGSICFMRRYAFEFCTDGRQRYQGFVEMLGKQVHQIHMDAYHLVND